MIGGLVGWLRETGDKVSFFVVPVQDAEKGFSWTDPGLIGAMIGAGVTGAVALIVLGLSTRIERNRRDEDRRQFLKIRADDLAREDELELDQRLRQQASLALRCFSKLSRYANSIYATKNAIDENIKSAHKAGIHATEISMLIGPFAGKFTLPERLNTEEYEFLFTKENVELLGEIEDMESQAIHLDAVCREYTQRQLDFQSWRESNLEIKSDMDGPRGIDAVPPELMGRYNLRIAQLNRLAYAMIQVTEREHGGRDPVDVVKGFISATQAAPFAEHMPKLDYGK